MYFCLEEVFFHLLLSQTGILWNRWSLSYEIPYQNPVSSSYSAFHKEMVGPAGDLSFTLVSYLCVSAFECGQYPLLVLIAMVWLNSHPLKVYPFMLLKYCCHGLYSRKAVGCVLRLFIFGRQIVAKVLRWLDSAQAFCLPLPQATAAALSIWCSIPSLRQ